MKERGRRGGRRHKKEAERLKKKIIKKDESDVDDKKMR